MEYLLDWIIFGLQNASHSERWIPSDIISIRHCWGRSAVSETLLS